MAVGVKKSFVITVFVVSLMLLYWFSQYVASKLAPDIWSILYDSEVDDAGKYLSLIASNAFLIFWALCGILLVVSKRFGLDETGTSRWIYCIYFSILMISLQFYSFSYIIKVDYGVSVSLAVVLSTLLIAYWRFFILLEGTEKRGMLKARGGRT